MFSEISILLCCNVFGNNTLKTHTKTHLDLLAQVEKIPFTLSTFFFYPLKLQMFLSALNPSGIKIAFGFPEDKKQYRELCVCVVLEGPN